MHKLPFLFRSQIGTNTGTMSKAHNYMLPCSNKQVMAVNSLVTSFFAQFKVLVGKPQYKTISRKVVVQIPYFVPKTVMVTGNLLTVSDVPSERNMSALGSAITLLFNPDLEPIRSQIGKCSQVEVRFIRLRYPYLDSTILAQYLALNAGKYNFTRMQKGVFSKVPVISSSSKMVTADQVLFPLPIADRNEHRNNTVLPASALPGQLTGVKLELAGRLTTQRSIPRKTVDNTHTGSFTVSKELNSLLDFSQYASKNKLGAFTMKV